VHWQHINTHLADAASGQQPSIKEGVTLGAQPPREMAPRLANAPAPVRVLPDLCIVPVEQQLCSIAADDK
jgi:hypothetical protein